MNTNVHPGVKSGTFVNTFRPSKGANNVTRGHHHQPSSSFPSESKHTLQILEPCSGDELCLSMGQCANLNPNFMAKTGLQLSKSGKLIVSGSNYSEPIKIKVSFK